MKSSLENSIGRETLERKEKGKMSELTNSNSLIQNGKHLGRENKEGSNERKVSVYAKMSDVKEAMLLRQHMLVLMYKEVLIISNEITNGLPSVVVDLL